MLGWRKRYDDAGVELILFSMEECMTTSFEFVIILFGLYTSGYRSASSDRYIHRQTGFRKISRGESKHERRLSSAVDALLTVTPRNLLNAKSTTKRATARLFPSLLRNVSQIHRGDRLTSLFLLLLHVGLWLQRLIPSSYWLCD